MRPLIRSFRETDLSMILASWLNTYYSGMKDYRPQKSIYFKHHQELAKLKLRGDVRVLCNAEDEDQIIGWAVFEGDVLHYVYVKSIFRGFGFGKKLLEGKSVAQVSHLTHDLRKVIPKPIYNPYLFK